MQSIFAVAAILLAIVVLATVSATDAASERGAFLRTTTKHRRFAATTSRGCADNITDAIKDAVHVAELVVDAAFECPKKNNTEECISIVTSISDALLGVAKRIDEAVTACGGQGSACAQDLLSAGQEASDAAGRIAMAISQCKDKEIIKCIQDVTETALDVEELVGSIRKAAMTCGKKQ